MIDFIPHKTPRKCEGAGTTLLPRCLFEPHLEALRNLRKRAMPVPITLDAKNRVNRGLAVIRVKTSPTRVVRVLVPARIASMPVFATSVVKPPPFL